MSNETSDNLTRRVLAAALLAFPCVFILMSIMHFNHFANFFSFRLRYVPRSPERVVAALIASHNRWPLFHDPHMIGFAALPIFVLCSFALYVLGSRTRPFASAVAMMITISGTIYMGGVFGMWTAFFRGIGNVDPSYQAGAIATFSAMTAPQGAFLFTTTMAKLAMVGLGLQALLLLWTRAASAWSTISIAAGCCLFLLFWDLDNWMLIGMVLILAGFIPIRRALLRKTGANGEPAALSIE